ncbi:MAG: aspartate-semialdehyde dehydrogenase [Anaerolineae bacterium]|nr:aspartate-semialdehyde dehydrogenase [Anaerolineae bacterium]
MVKIPVGVLGATGAVGQRFIQLLDDHPWFEVAALAASDRSVGRTYGEACHWLLATPMPARVRDMVVQPTAPGLACRLVFSALPASVASQVEETFAAAGYAVCSNASAHRMDPDVPLLIPEVNPDHTALLDVQRQRRGWKGLIAASSNCSSMQLTLALKPLHDAFGVDMLHVTTLQAVSGAGYPGVPSLDIVGNVVPHIAGEEAKMESEPQKMLGTLRDGRVVAAPFVTSAQCNRVPVRDGHVECVSVSLVHKPLVEEVVVALSRFRASPEVTALPSTPDLPIVVRFEPDRPQPILDRDAGAGYAVSVGRIRPCPLLDYRFVVLGHNTVRGAAGGSIHNAELLVSQGWIA